MKTLFSLFAVLFLMTSAIPKERNSTPKPRYTLESVASRAQAYDSLAASVIEFNKVLNHKP